MRRILATVFALVLVAGVASPVSAGSISFHKADYHQFSFDWIQLDRNVDTGERIPPGVNQFGNTHIGFVYTFEITSGVMDAFGQIADLDCPVDFVPPAGGHGFGALEEEPEPEPENPCTHIGFRTLQGSLPFTVDRKLTAATLGGPGQFLAVFGGGDPHGGGGEQIGQAPVNMAFIGSGPLTKSTFTDRYTDGTNTYSSRYSSTGRSTEMTGALGPMGFDPDLSGGFISFNKEMFRSRSR